MSRASYLGAWRRALCFVAFLLPLAVAQAAQISAGSSGILSYSEAVMPNGVAQYAASILSPENTAGVMNANLGAQSLSNPDTLISPPPPSSTAFAGTFPDDTSAAQAVNNYLQPYLPSVGSSMANVLRSKGLSGGFFSFVQNLSVMTNGSPQQRAVVASMWVKPDGSYNYLGVKTSGGNPIVLYASYTQSQVVSGLPSGWAQPNAGAIQYQLLSLNMSGSGITLLPVTSLQTDNVAGAYDEPQSTGTTVDPDAGLKLMVSQWVVPHMQQNNAVFAVIDYGRTVAPVYDTAPDGTQTARVSISVDQRQFTANGCTNSQSLSENGRIGYLLDYGTDRYSVLQDGSYMFSQHFEQYGISPTQTFNKGAALPQGAQYASYTGDIIDPFNTSNIYAWQNDTVNGLPSNRYIYVAPLQNNSTSGSYVLYVAHYSDSSNAGIQELVLVPSPAEAPPVLSSFYDPYATVCDFNGCSSGVSGEMDLTGVTQAVAPLSSIYKEILYNDANSVNAAWLTLSSNPGSNIPIATDTDQSISGSTFTYNWWRSGITPANISTNMFYKAVYWDPNTGAYRGAILVASPSEAPNPINGPLFPGDWTIGWESVLSSVSPYSFQCQ